jgi:hypothetical protein
MKCVTWLYCVWLDSFVFISYGAATMSKLPEWWFFFDKTSYRSHLHRALFLKSPTEIGLFSWRVLQKSGSFTKEVYPCRNLLIITTQHICLWHDSLATHMYAYDMTHSFPICACVAWLSCKFHVTFSNFAFSCFATGYERREYFDIRPAAPVFGGTL